MCDSPHSTTLDWANRVRVLALASSMMRRVLLDYAEARHSRKRSGGVRIPLTDDAALARFPDDAVEFLDLNQALDALLPIDERRARIG